MTGKILKTLTNNLGFKILAVFFAFILWLVVYNIDDPTKTKTFTTNVTIENASAVTEMNKCYEVLNGTNTVSFSVTGKRSVLDKLENTDFTAVADMTRMVINSDGSTADVPIEISSTRQNSVLKYNGKAKYLEVSLEDLMSHRFMIEADTSGKVAPGYALGEVAVTNPNVLRVSGPASIVQKITKVIATIDVEGMSVNISDNVIPVLYDAKGKEVDTTRLTLSSETVSISAKILSVKEIPLVFSTTGSPSGGNRVVEISSSPEKIKLKGSSTVLNPLMSIEIPGRVLNVEGARADLTTTIDITEYLPEGVELVNPSDASVSVTVRIEAYEQKNYQIETNRISVQGLNKKYDISFAAPTVAVAINGLKNDLDKLKENDLAASVDVTGLGEGKHWVTLEVKLDEEHYAYQPITLEVTISAKDSTPSRPGEQQTSESENTSDSETNQNESENQ